MRFKVISILSIILLCCTTQEELNERIILERKVDAFRFLSKFHHQLHIMIGEEEGDIKKAFNQFYDALVHQNNFELAPIKDALFRIDSKNVHPSLDSVKRLDYLVDYYQSGLSMQIEGIFRGYGYLDVLDMEKSLSLYDKLKNDGSLKK
tara:strand:+ start:461 stop:907 length:447 start_codon:yes stop_codon:yes gene_type:complete